MVVPRRSMPSGSSWEGMPSADLIRPQQSQLVDHAWAEATSRSHLTGNDDMGSSLRARSQQPYFRSMEAFNDERWSPDKRWPYTPRAAWKELVLSPAKGDEPV